MASFDVVDFKRITAPPGWIQKSDLWGSQVDVADALGAIALGYPDERPLNWNIMCLEVEILARLLNLEPNGHLRRRPNFERVAGRFRRLCSEAIGLATTTRLAATEHGWRPHYGWPTDVDVNCRKDSGPRPDLLFVTPAGVVAGEARGRSQSRTSTRVTRVQQHKLDRLEVWARENGTNVFMAWSWTATDRTRVDHFDLGLETRRFDAPELTEALRSQAERLYGSATEADVGHENIADGFESAVRGVWLRPRSSDFGLFLGVLEPDLVASDVEALWGDPGRLDEDALELSATTQFEAQMPPQERLREAILERLSDAATGAVISAAVIGPVVTAVRATPAADIEDDHVR